MPVIDFAARRVEVAVAYAGPAMAGRTATFEALRRRLGAGRCGAMRVAGTRGGRSIGFQIDLGHRGEVSRGVFCGFGFRLELFTLPEGRAGAALLERADVVVFVADSTWGRIEAGVGAWRGLGESFAARGIARGEIPVVLQYNKRDLPEVAPSGYLDVLFSAGEIASARHGTEALSGRNIVKVLDDAVKLVLAKGALAGRE